MRYLTPLIVLAIVGCFTTDQRATQPQPTGPESTTLNKPIPVPPEMERRDIMEPNPYLRPEGW